MKTVRTAVAVALLAAACSGAAESSTTVAPPADPSEPPAAGPVPLIVDYSPTVSDAGALLYLLSNPDVDVLAITLPVTGEAGCELGAEVTLGILTMLDRTDIPVACDPETPPDARAWPAEFLTGHESLTFGLPQAGIALDTRPAHRLIADVVAASAEPVTIYAVAPLTNVARALDQHPAIDDGIERIVIMGGAVDAAGNVPDSDAEWNLWIDPEASASVLGSGVPVTLVPLDATNDVPVPDLWRSDLEAAEQSDAVAYLTTLVRLFPAVTGGFFYLWDELAAAVAAGADPASTEDATLAVTADGATVRDQSGAAVRLATGVPDPAAFYRHFLETISGGAVEEREVVAFDASSVPAIDATSKPVEVLAAWLLRSTQGDVAAVDDLLSPEAGWEAFGASPEVYVEGAEPYAAYDLAVECSGTDELAHCDLTFRDRWIDGIPELEHGSVRAEVAVADGLITEFRAFVFDAVTAAAFDAHGAWLEANRPAELAVACQDPAARPCSELFVSTVDAWVASR